MPHLRLTLPGVGLPIQAPFMRGSSSSGVSSSAVAEPGSRALPGCSGVRAPWWLALSALKHRMVVHTSSATCSASGRVRRAVRDLVWSARGGASRLSSVLQRRTCCTQDGGPPSHQLQQGGRTTTRRIMKATPETSSEMRVWGAVGCTCAKAASTAKVGAAGCMPRRCIKHQACS